MIEGYGNRAAFEAYMVFYPLNPTALHPGAVLIVVILTVGTVDP